MKPRRPLSLVPALEGSLTIRTGEHCPESGWWFPLQPGATRAPSQARFIGEGNVMPAAGGVPIVWVPAEPQRRDWTFDATSV